MMVIGYVLLSVAAFCLLVLMIAGMIAAFPFGIIGLLALAGIAFLLAHVLKTRAANKEDDYYVKNVDK
jgi:hypothetical protein